MGFSMLAPILGGIYLGKYLDAKFETTFWIIVLSLIGVFSGLYLALKDFIKSE
jgi:F0F1-type ATP synthase assembly protein I